MLFVFWSRVTSVIKVKGKGKRWEDDEAVNPVMYSDRKDREGNLTVPLATNLFHASSLRHSSPFSPVINLSAFNPSPAYPAVPSKISKNGSQVLSNSANLLSGEKANLLSSE